MITRHVTFPGSAPAGEEPPLLEAHLTMHSDGALHPGVVLCHANPAAGGHMEMDVMLALEEALVKAGFGTLRYNSRGIGGSGGAVSLVETNRLVVPEGEAEMLDVGAALNFLSAQEGVNSDKLALVGHSFGARICLAYLAAHPDDHSVAAVACIGLAVAWRDLSHLGQWPHPKLFVTAERDDFSPPDMLRAFADRLPEPATTVVLRRTGHFFEGREHDLAAVVATFLVKIIGNTT